MTNLVQQFVTFNKASYHGSTESGMGHFTAKFCRYCKERHFTPTTFTSENAAEWINYMLRYAKVSPNTVRYYSKILRRIFKFAVARGIRPDNPFEKSLLPVIRPARINRQHFTWEEYRHVKEIAAGHTCDAFWVTACMLAWHVGLRLSDVALLQWSNVDFVDQVIRVAPKKKHSVREVLAIPMEPELIERLLLLWSGRDDSERYVLPDMRRHYIRRSASLSDKFGAICDKAGLPHKTFHSFRHSFVSRLINSGVDPITIGEMTGQTIEIIQQYAHVSLEAKQNALRKSREFIMNPSDAPPAAHGIAVSEF